ncbi:hypothetical protein BpHYR1_052108 [Brachionus plicatilis]|uniref:Uncharacterized protein n=1 Tax=Brachionus plicatilis TaxID=10195 RepID=A0A3M7RPD4_BRAPC|nr:hypothetical protein BpHYR1_052108 [Brachionus plicatilis]
MSQTQDFLQAPFTFRSINKKLYIKRSLTTIIQLNNMLGHLKKEHAMELGYQNKILEVKLFKIQNYLKFLFNFPKLKLPRIVTNLMSIAESLASDAYLGLGLVLVEVSSFSSSCKLTFILLELFDESTLFKLSSSSLMLFFLRHMIVAVVDQPLVHLVNFVQHIGLLGLQGELVLGLGQTVEFLTAVQGQKVLTKLE